MGRQRHPAAHPAPERRHLGGDEARLRRPPPGQVPRPRPCPARLRLAELPLGLRLLLDPVREQLLPPAFRRRSGGGSAPTVGGPRIGVLHVRGRDHEPPDPAQRRRGPGDDVRRRVLVRRDPVRRRSGRRTRRAAPCLRLPTDELRPGVGEPAGPRPDAQRYADRGRLREHHRDAPGRRADPSVRDPRLSRRDSGGGRAYGRVRGGRTAPVRSPVRRRPHDLGRFPLRAGRAFARRHAARGVRRSHRTPGATGRPEPEPELPHRRRAVPAGQSAGRRGRRGVGRRHHRMVPGGGRPHGAGD